MPRTVIPSLFSMKVGDAEARLQLERLRIQDEREREARRVDLEAARAEALQQALDRALGAGIGAMDRYQAEQRRKEDVARDEARDKRDYELKVDQFGFQKGQTEKENERLALGDELDRLKLVAPGVAAELQRPVQMDEAPEVFEDFDADIGSAKVEPTKLLDNGNFQATPENLTSGERVTRRVDGFKSPAEIIGRATPSTQRSSAVTRPVEVKQMAALDKAAADVADVINSADDNDGPEAGRSAGFAALDKKVDELAGQYKRLARSEIRALILQQMEVREKQKEALDLEKSDSDRRFGLDEKKTESALRANEAEVRLRDAQRRAVDADRRAGGSSANRSQLDAIYKDITVAGADLDDLRSQEQRALTAAAQARAEAQRLLGDQSKAVRGDEREKYGQAIRLAQGEVQRNEDIARQYRERIEQKRNDVVSLQRERDSLLGMKRPARGGEASNVLMVAPDGRRLSVPADQVAELERHGARRADAATGSVSRGASGNW